MIKFSRFFALFAVTLLFCVSVASAQWVKQTVDTSSSFRGLSVVSERVVWASGTGGTVIRTIDGGKTWKVMTVPGAEKLDFRDIEAFDGNSVYILSIGNGDASRIYKTTDGGKTWKLQFKNTNEKAFFDAMACPNKDECYAVSDPVSGLFLVIATADGWDHWLLQWPLNPLSAVPGEAAFAASGTCLIVDGNYFFLVSGGSRASVYKVLVGGGDHGEYFKHFDTPIISGSSGSGIFSIAMSGPKNGVIVGGDYEKPAEHEKNLAFTTDGGETWKLSTGLSGFRSGVTYVDGKTIIAVGTNGSDISRDGGATWLRIDGSNYNAVQARGKNSVWAVGPKGYVVTLNWKEFLDVNGDKPCPKNVICDGPWMYDLRLSHNEIGSDCPQTNSQCSNKRQIEVAALASDVPPNWYDYSVSGGRIVGFGSRVIWDLSDSSPGTYIITAGLKLPSGEAFRVSGRTVTKTVAIK